MGLQSLCQRRFAQRLAFRRQMWAVLCRDFCQGFVPDDATVVEIGSGYCEFISETRAWRTIAVQLNPDTRTHAGPDVTVIASSMSRVEPRAYVLADIVFASNILETARFEVVHLVRRFLSFTTEGRLPTSIPLLRLYLKLPLGWRVFGQQSFLVALPRA